MADTIKLDILTPRGAKRDAVDVTGVEVPGVLGELGILPHHEALITAVVPGVVRFREGGKPTRLAVGAGFLEVKEAGRAILLVDRALEPQEVNVEAARARLKELKDQIDRHQGALNDPARIGLVDEYNWVDAQLRAATG